MVLRTTSCTGLILLAVALAGAQSPDVNTIVSRMMAAAHENNIHAHGFTVKRDYQILDKEMEPKAQVVANITFLPPNQRQYRIESAKGGVGEKVLRDILARETEEPKDPKRKEISPENYNFRLLGTGTVDNRPCYVLALDPRRDEKDLIRGEVWVDAQTYQIRRAEGNPAKSPSWWVRDVYILMTFAEVDGMWLRIFTHATANIRFKGRFVMVARDLEYQPARPAAVLQHRKTPILAGAVLNP